MNRCRGISPDRRLLAPGNRTDAWRFLHSRSSSHGWRQPLGPSHELRTNATDPATLVGVAARAATRECKRYPFSKRIADLHVFRCEPAAHAGFLQSRCLAWALPMCGSKSRAGARVANPMHLPGRRRRPAREETERRATNTPHGSRCCCSGCSGCSCCGRLSARCPNCCSRTRRAARGSRNLRRRNESPPPWAYRTCSHTTPRPCPPCPTHPSGTRRPDLAPPAPRLSRAIMISEASFRT